MRLLLKGNLSKRPFFQRIIAFFEKKANQQLCFGILVLICTLLLLPSHFVIHTQGIIVAQKSQKVISLVPSRITHIAVHAGQQVKTGDLLVQLRNPVVEASYEQAFAEFELIKLDYMRNSEYGSWSDQSKVPALALALEAAASKLQLAEKYANDLTLYAQLNGTVIGTRIDALIGTYAKTGEMLFEVADLSQLKILIPLSEEDALHITKNNRVRIRLDADGTLAKSHISLIPEKRMHFSELQPAYFRPFGGPAPLPNFVYQRNINPKEDTSLYPLYIAEAPLPITHSTTLIPGMRADITIEGKRTILLFKLWTTFLHWINL